MNSVGFDTGVQSLVALVLVPWFYVATGWTLDALRSKGTAPTASTAPLKGVLFWGALGLLRIVIGGSALYWEGVAVFVLFAIAWRRRNALRQTMVAWRETQVVWWTAYALLTVVLTVSPFPGLWLMGGDWLQHFGMARAIHLGAFGMEHLARSPLFAAAAAPLLDAGGELAAFQIFNATVATAAWLPIIRQSLITEASRMVRVAAWIALAISPFLTVNLQNLWPKFLAGGCMVLALDRAASARESKRTSNLMVSGAWFGFSILAHESSVLYLPLWIAAAWTVGTRVAIGRVAAALAVCGVIVGAWQGWTLLRFGLDARVASNPAVTFASDIPLWQKAFLNLVRLFCGTIWADMVSFWKASQIGWTEKFYYTVVVGVTSAGGTVLGITAIWLVSARRSWLKDVVRETLQPRSRRLLIGATISAGVYLFVLGGIANGVGAVQGALLPLAMWIAGLAIMRLETADADAIRRTMLSWLLFGWVPYVAVGAAVGVMLNWPDQFQAQIAQLVSYDDDLRAIFKRGLEPMGMHRLTWLLGALASTGVFFSVIFLSKRMRRNFLETPALPVSSEATGSNS